ncbi:cardiolipin synthase [Pseudalkalibacillus caeni]|uniref:Cardiolipin synthase n=1 Tax=Exobacillus caeni TaxID=2574798 RepID=A0A5R9F7A1_9BACL|nr:cardiolipin synthase [Pseudalkalibacillus caeni]TLS38140.1 cardiolipin synthase [Pseudalkalibacillus caeni]
MKQTRQFLMFLAMVFSVYAVLFFSSFPVKLAAICIYFLILLSISYVLILENRSPYKTLLWIYVLFFFPVIGFIFFIYSGQLEVKGHLFKSKKEQNMASLKKYINFQASPKWHDLSDRDQSFSNLIARMANSPISFYSSTTLLTNGEETFPAIINSLKRAENYIHMEYYIFRSDKIGKTILDLLIDKAKQGVEIRFLYDAVGSYQLSREDIHSLEEAGVKVSCFLPIKHGFFNQKLNFRNHRKIIVIDGKVGYVGGLNVGDEYAGYTKEYGYWRDSHLKVSGEALRPLHHVFLADWAYQTGEELDYDHYLETYEVKGDGGVQVVAGGPDTRQGIMSDLYYSMITDAKKTICIATPYFIPNKAIRAALIMASLRGVRVQLLVPNISDSFLTEYATKSYFPELMAAGIEVYEYQKGFLHQKVMIIDSEIATIGTANMDMRSFHLNFEVNVFLFHTTSVDEMVKAYTEDLLKSVKVSPDAYKLRGYSRRTKESIARLFSPIL